MPRGLSFQHTAAGLFTQRSTRWWEHHLEATNELGAKTQARELDEWALFPMGAFGYRTRYDRLLIETGRSSHVVTIRRRLAEHALTRMKKLGHPLPEELRLVRSYWTVGSPALATPEGLWATPPIQNISGPDRQVLGAYRLKNGGLEPLPGASSKSIIAQRPTPASTKSSPPMKASPVNGAGVFQRPGTPPQSFRNQITRRQLQRLVSPALKPGTVPPTTGNVAPQTQPRHKVPGGVDVSRLKLSAPGVPIQKMPEAKRK